MIENSINALSSWITEYAKGELNLFIRKRRKTSTGKLREGLTYRAVKRGQDYRIELIGKAEHSKFVHFGRRPGKFPPPMAIRKWIDDKPIRLQDKQKGGFIKRTEANKRKVAFLIGRKIKEKGIEPFPYFTRAVEASATKARPLWEAVIKEQIKFYFRGN